MKKFLTSMERKSMVKKFIVIMGGLIILELVCFVGMFMCVMSDEPPPKTAVMIGRFFYGTLKYIFGFPLVLINSNYPFYLDSSSPWMIFLALINNSILSLLIITLLGGLKKLGKTSN